MIKNVSVQNNTAAKIIPTVTTTKPTITTATASTKTTVTNTTARPTTTTKPVQNKNIPVNVVLSKEIKSSSKELKESTTEKHKSQRVAVFVDVQNMYYSGKNLYNRKVNFQAILKKAICNRNLIRAFAYVIKADIPEEQSFRAALSSQGYEVKSKDLQIFYDGNKKGDWDVGIAMDTIRMASKVDTIVLVSGDGDFADLAIYLKGMGCRVEVIGFEKTTSSRLTDVADDFTPIDKNYLI